MGAETPRHIAPTAAAAWFGARLALKEETAVAYLGIVRWWIEWLIEGGKLGQDPTSGIKAPPKNMQPRRKFLLPPQARTVIDDCADDHLKFALYCGLQQGFRKKEVIEARPEWFDVENGLGSVVTR